MHLQLGARSDYAVFVSQIKINRLKNSRYEYLNIEGAKVNL